MEVYVFIKNGEFLCKKSKNKLYTSDEEVDRMITYRRKSDAENMAKDKKYWEYRDINIDDFKIMLVDLYFGIIREIE